MNPKIQYKWTALSITSLGLILGVLNSSTLIIALPTIMVKLHTDLISIMWVLICYMLALTILAPAWGRLADIYGRRDLYIFGLATFTLGSFLCGFSETVTQLIIFRIVQAVGGSLIVANSTVIVADSFKKGELGKAMGINSMIIAATFAFGPILGGFLTMIDWRWNFFFNVPVGIFVTAWAYYQLREVVELPVNQKLDILGMFALVITLLSFLSTLTVGFLLGGLTMPFLLLLAATLGSFATFVYVERKVRYPLIDLQLFRIRIFSYGQITSFLNSIARGTVMFLLILFFQGLMGYDPLVASILILPMAVGITITGPIGGILSDKYGSRSIATIGLCISLVGLAGLSALHYDTEYVIIAIWMFSMGIGSGLFQAPNTCAIMASVPPERRGIASATRTLLMNVGMIISMGVIFPFILSTVSMQELLDMFVVGSGNMPVAAKIVFTNALDIVFIGSSVITVLAIIVSALRGEESRIEQTKSEN